MAVERLTGDAEFGTELTDFRLGFAHGRLRQPQFRRRHLEGPAAVAPAGSCCGEAGIGALDDQLALELRQRREEVEHQPAVGRGGVDRGALAGEHLQPDAASIESLHDIDEVLEAAAQPIELPDHQRVAIAQRSQAGLQSWAVVAFSRRAIGVELIDGDAGRHERVGLQIDDLAAVRLAHAHVAYQHQLLPFRRRHANGRLSERRYCSLMIDESCH